VLKRALVVAIMALPSICYSQDPAQNTTRRIERFSFSFEPDEVVELELTTTKPDEISRDEFLTLEFFNNRQFIMNADFNLSQLPLIRIAAARTGFGKAKLTVNGVAGGIVPIRRDRIYLFVRALVNTTGRDYETDELILIPSETNLRGLITTVDGDGVRSTRTVVTTSMKIRVSE
jgi:hypothetical protein